MSKPIIIVCIIMALVIGIIILSIKYSHCSTNQQTNQQLSQFGLTSNVFVIRGNIAVPPLKVDAVVNAGNTKLSTGTMSQDRGGVTGALIDAVGGYPNWLKILSNPNNKLWNGKTFIKRLPSPIKMTVCTDVAITPVSQPNYDYIVNVAGPDCNGNGNVNVLQSCYKNVMDAITKFGNIKSIIFPFVSDGIFNCPRAKEIAISTLVQYPTKIRIYIIYYN